jgi:hypothetical protein
VSDEDCDGDLICDVHDGQGTCQHDHGHGDGDTGGETHGDTEGDVDCASETRGDEYAVGLSKSGAEVTATFVLADPAPPAMGDNTWVLAFTDGEGTPVDELDWEVALDVSKGDMQDSISFGFCVE